MFVMRLMLIVALLAMWGTRNSPRAEALIVEDMTGTTTAPTDDPGWNNITISGSHNFIYLGNSWALSAFHVGYPISGNGLRFSTGSFPVLQNKVFTVRNPTGSGLTEFTDLRLVRLNGDPNLPSIFDPNPQFTIAASPVTSSTPEAQREVVIIGRGPSRQPNLTQWKVTVVAGNNNDTWQTPTTEPTHSGYFAMSPSDDTKRWGKNQIANEDPIFGGSDPDLRGTVQYALGVGPRDVVSMVTRFDQQPDLQNPSRTGLPNEFQAVSGDSGSAIFHKRNGQWELIGIVNGIHSTYDNQPGPFSNPPSLSTAVYGNYTLFADLSYYRNEILSIINDPEMKKFSINGDVNLDGLVSGNGSGPTASDDVSAFLAGWRYSNGKGIGDYTSWTRGDLNLDGKTDAADFFVLRNALNPSGSGSFLPSLEALLGGVGVPEPSSILLALAGALMVTSRRRRPRGRRID